MSKKVELEYVYNLNGKFVGHKCKIGDEVEWKSSSNGKTSFKRGKVIEVYPAFSAPDARFYKRAYSIMFDGGCRRNHESYLVEVAAPEGSKAKPKLYHPRTSSIINLTKQK